MEFKDSKEFGVRFESGATLELFDVITGRVYLSLNTIKEEPEYSGLYTWKEEAAAQSVLLRTGISWEESRF